MSVAPLFQATRLKQADRRLAFADHGNNDPVARKILAKHAGESGLAPPADPDIVCFPAASP